MAQYDSVKEQNRSPQSFDLSIGQKELWFIHSMGGSAQSAYNEPLIYSLKGYLPVNALKKAFDALMEKHGILRTSFEKDHEGNLFQVVHERVPLDFTLVEIANESDISAYITKEISKPFDFKQASMMRVSLIKRSEDEHVLIIVLHHIITDGTSFFIFVNDLNTIYSQIMRDEILNKSQNQATFYDHVVFEKKNFVSADYLEQIDKTVEQLKGYSGLNFLTTPVGQEHIDIFSGNRVYFTLEKTICEQINQFSQTQRSTVFHVLYAAYSIFIQQYTRSHDFSLVSLLRIESLILSGK